MQYLKLQDQILQIQGRTVQVNSLIFMCIVENIGQFHGIF